ncbi:DUF4145 domain-containing protein [Aliivibrio fischeri]|uniref:DUF4145 domain-containing protein n=1 Tax=Aliivibrio fischeri TaxID=668 RepID=UPI00354B7E23
MESCMVESACSGVLQCNYDHCQEFVSFCGEARGDDVEIHYDEYPDIWDLEYVDKITIKYIFPSPKLIPLSNKYPTIINTLLEDSFCLYWSSPSSCANKLRIIVEEILNDLKIPKKHKTKKSKLVLSTTHHRIGRLGNKTKFKEASEYLLAIKEIGNPASHASSFDENAIIPAYKLLNKALDLIYIGYDKELNRLKELAKNKKLV